MTGAGHPALDLDKKLWDGAAAAGWSQSRRYPGCETCKNWLYTSPDGEVYTSAKKARAAAKGIAHQRPATADEEEQALYTEKGEQEVKEVVDAMRVDNETGFKGVSHAHGSEYAFRINQRYLDTHKIALHHSAIVAAYHVAMSERQNALDEMDAMEELTPLEALQAAEDEDLPLRKSTGTGTGRGGQGKTGYRYIGHDNVALAAANSARAKGRWARIQNHQLVLRIKSDLPGVKFSFKPPALRYISAEHAALAMAREIKRIYKVLHPPHTTSLVLTNPSSDPLDVVLSLTLPLTLTRRRDSNRPSKPLEDLSASGASKAASARGRLVRG